MGNFGDSIEQYEVLDLLGKGGFAVVYRARCSKNGVDVAIKMIDKKVSKAKHMDGRVKEEVSIHSRLKHPSVLELYTCFEDENYVYLVLELCQNGELQRYLKTTKSVLSEHEACNILRQVVEGLLYLHSHSIIHRDMKLSNLLLTAEMNIKIADFGLATQLAWPDEKHMTMCGTPNYISPEVATRSSHGLETDLWGMGVILYAMLVGNPPFDAKDCVQSTIALIVMAEAHLPSTLSVEARDLITCLLKKNPGERIKLCGILGHPFMNKNRNVVRTDASKRWLSCDSGVASSYLTSSLQNSQMQSRGVLPAPTVNSESKMSCPTSAISNCGVDVRRIGSCCSSSSGSTNHSLASHRSSEVSHRSRTSSSRSTLKSQSGSPGSDRDFDLGSHQMLSYVPHEERIQGTASVSCLSTRDNCASQKSNSNLSFKATNCSHAWKQCTQCSHVDTCGCMCFPKNCSGGNTRVVMDAASFPVVPVNTTSSTVQMPFKTVTQNLSEENALGSHHTQERQIQHKPQQQEIKISIPVLNSNRLGPVRLKAKNVIVNIMDTGEVCMEFLKTVGGVQRVTEVLRISADGMRIVTYNPNGGKGTRVGAEPPALPVEGADASYNYENMPEKNWKKYSYASKFVDLVKSKTPKVTFYSSSAKCVLMENGPNADFEAHFYEGGKVTKAGSQVKLVEGSGAVLSFDVKDNPRLSPGGQLIWEHFKKCLKHCETLERAMESASANTEESCFPLVVGRRIQQSFTTLQSANCNKENKAPQSVVNAPTMGGYETSLSSAAPGSKRSKSKKLISNKTISGIGTATQLANGDIHVNYGDGSRLIVNSTSPNIAFITNKGQMNQYKQNDVIPHDIRTKLSQMPHIIKALMESS